MVLVVVIGIAAAEDAMSRLLVVEIRLFDRNAVARSEAVILASIVPSIPSIWCICIDIDIQSVDESQWDKTKIDE